MQYCFLNRPNPKTQHIANLSIKIICDFNAGHISLAYWHGMHIKHYKSLDLPILEGLGITVGAADDCLVVKVFRYSFGKMDLIVSATQSDAKQ